MIQYIKNMVEYKTKEGDFMADYNVDETNEKRNNTAGRVPKTLYEYFDTYSEDEINKVISTLNKNDINLLQKAYGQDLKDKTLLRKITRNEKSKIYYIRKKISESLKSRQEKIKQRNKVKTNNTDKPKKTKSYQTKTHRESFTKNSSSDVIRRIEYKKLSRDEERKMIKKAQLSYYYKVDENLQKKFLNQYFEVFPTVKKRYENLEYLISEKENLLQKDYPNLDKEEKIEFLKTISEQIKELVEKKRKLLEKSIGESKIYRDRFLENNLKLVASIVVQPKYIKNAPFDDLFIEGNIGMFKALSMFDVEKGYKFSTYATWWINQTIGRCIKKSKRIIKFPINVEEKLSKINRAIEEIEKHGRTATPEEVSKLTDFNIDIVLNLLEIRNNLTFPLSLNDNVGVEEGSELENFIPSDENPYLAVEDKIYTSEVIKIVDNSNLDERTLQILKLRYGLIDEIPKTLEEIGKMFGISKERVRQIEINGIETLRKNSKLLEFCNSEQGYTYKIKKR